MRSTLTLDSTATGRFTVKQVDLLSTAHFYTDLQQKEMVNLDDNDTGGAMVAQARCANSVNKTDFTTTRK